MKHLQRVECQACYVWPRVDVLHQGGGAGERKEKEENYPLPESSTERIYLKLCASSQITWQRLGLNTADVLMLM